MRKMGDNIIMGLKEMRRYDMTCRQRQEYRGYMLAV